MSNIICLKYGIVFVVDLLLNEMMVLIFNKRDYFFFICLVIINKDEVFY